MREAHRQVIQAALEDCQPKLLVVDAALEAAGAALAESIAGLKQRRGPSHRHKA
jgi:hypothetical protein